MSAWTIWISRGFNACVSIRASGPKRSSEVAMIDTIARPRAHWQRETICGELLMWLPIVNGCGARGAALCSSQQGNRMLGEDGC
jgi:hypothetical protein